MTLQLIFEWSSLILLMGLGVYTMWVIKNEQKTYIKNAREVHFKQFKFFVPNWWSDIPVDSSNTELCFKRTDTRYDWEARFIWNEKVETLDIVDLFKNHIAERKILFDEETSIIYNPSDFREGALITSGRYEINRLSKRTTLLRCIFNS